MASFADDFNRADGAPGSSWSQEVGGSYLIASNRLARQGGGSDAILSTTAMAGADHGAQMKVYGNLTSVGGIFASVVIRNGAGFNSNCYFGYWHPNEAKWTIEKGVGGSFAEVGTPVADSVPASGFLLRFEAEGSTLRLYADGVLKVTATDTDNTGTGVGLSSSGGEFDDYAAADLGPAGTTLVVANAAHADSAANVTLTVPTVEQEGFRFRNDDGSQTAATWRQAQDAGDGAAVGEQLRLRVLLNTASDYPSSSFRLGYKKDSEAAGDWRAVGVGRTPTFVAAGTMSAFASGTTITTTIPTAQANDIMVLAQMANGSTTFSTPAGWTLLGTSIESNANQSTEWYWKRHTGSESSPASTTSATMSATVGGYGRVYLIRGCVTSGDPFEAVTMTGAPTTDNNPDSAAITTLGSNRLVMCFLSVDDDNTWSSGNPPALWSAAGTAVISTTGGDAMMDALQLAVPAAGSVAAVTIGTMSAADYWRSLTLAFLPAAPAIDVATSTQFADGDATTAQLTAPSGKTTSDFAAGVMVETDATANAVDVPVDDYTEIEWAIKVQTPAVNTDVYQLRVTVAGTAIDTYTVTPAITVGSVAVNLVVADAAHAHTAGNVDLVQQHVLVVANALHAHSATVVSFGLAYPATVSARKWLDQNGDVYLVKTMSSWLLGQEASNAEITNALEGLAELGFNGVTCAPLGAQFNGSQAPYVNDAGQPFFATTAGGTTSSTPFTSELGAGWSSMDWIMTEATRLGMTVFFVLFVSYTGTGVQGDIVAAGNTAMRTYGQRVATRYAAYPNIVWHSEVDTEFAANAPIGQAIDYYHRGIADIEAGTRRLIVAEPDYDVSSYTQFISQEGTSPSGYQWFHLDANTPIRDNPEHESVVIRTENCWNEATTLPEAIWCDEPVYVHDPYYDVGNFNQQVREQNYSIFIEGGAGINFGNAWFCFCGADGIGASSPPGGWGDWLAELDDITTIEAGYCWNFIDQFCADLTWQPVSNFITTGEGSGDTKAAQGRSDSAALAYFPSDRTVQVDTTILPGSGNVRLRWFDPVANSYTTIAASEAQQTGRSVTLPAAHGDGSRDYILVVELTGVYDLAVDNALHAHSAANVTLTISAVTLTVADTLHAHTADNVALVQQHQLAVDGAVHGHTADNVLLVAAGSFTLTVQSAGHGHTADNVALVQQHVLVVASASHTHTAANITLSIGTAGLVLNDAIALRPGTATATKAYVGGTQVWP